MPNFEELLVRFKPPKRKGRKPIEKKGSKRAQLRLDQKGKCWRCGRGFDAMGVVRTHIHHKDGNPSNNRYSNLALVCGTCHDNLTHEQTLKRRKKPPKLPKLL